MKTLRKFWLWVKALFAPSKDKTEELVRAIKAISNEKAISNLPEDRPRAIYRIEEDLNFLNTKRKPDDGERIDLSKVSDDDFRNKIYVYCNGQLLWNDPVKAEQTDKMQNDVARWSYKPQCLVFAGGLRKRSVIQIVDMR